MVTRKSMSKKTRFEVFKRDSFKCQYCGKSAPEVVLNVDHIKPVADGGKNEMINLITSCFDCNSGKRDILLNDNSMLEKQKKQLDELNERRNQLEMMMQWKEGLQNIESDKLNIAREKYETASSAELTESGLKKLKTIVKKYPFDIVLDSIEAATSQYLKFDKDGEITLDSKEKAFSMIGRICTNKVNSDKEPEYKQKLHYIRGILRNRLNYCNDRQCMDLLDKAYTLGASLESLTEFSKEVKHWTAFKNELEDFIDKNE